MSAAVVKRRTLPGSVTLAPYLKQSNDQTINQPISPEQIATYWSQCSDSFFACQCLLEQLGNQSINQPKEQIDTFIWINETLRLTIKHLINLSIKLSTNCSSTTCPIMMATNDWEFLCAAHSKPQKCAAIDYLIHTITQAQASINDPEVVQNRSSVSAKSMTAFSSMSRRLYRLFAHARHHHVVIWRHWEDETGATERFLKLVREHGLMEEAQLTPAIPM